MKTVIATAILLVTDFFSEQPALARTSYPLANFFFHPWLQGAGWRELANFESVVTFVSIFMIIYATDSTRLGRAFIRALREYDLKWKNFDISCFNINSFKDDDNHETNIRVCILELIALRTAAITPLVLFPFLILSLMIVSRSAIFEGWQWSLELVIVYAGLFGYVLYHAFMLQREASLTRRKELEFLHAIPLKTEIWKLEKPEREKQEMYLKAAVSHVTNLDGGAFVAWYKHPIFQAIILPTSGTSGLFLLQGFF
jgi:hypothetical protein